MFEKISAKYSSYNNHSLSALCSFKQKWCSWESGQFSLQCRPTAGTVPQDSLRTSAHRKDFLWTQKVKGYPTEVKRHTQALRFGKLMIFVLPPGQPEVSVHSSCPWMPLLYEGAVLPLLPLPSRVHAVNMATPWWWPWPWRPLTEFSHSGSTGHPRGALLRMTKRTSTAWVLRKWLSEFLAHYTGHEARKIPSLAVHVHKVPPNWHTHPSICSSFKPTKSEGLGT